jgi:putative tryptophan/tyrosine transport system substrate-binding protein
MQRREFIALLGGATATWPTRALAQKAPVRIGFLASGAHGSAFSTAQIDNIKQGLRENGLVEGRDYVLDTQFAAGDYELFPDMTHKLMQAGARILLVNTVASTRAAQNVNPPVPVVMLNINDPVGTGLVRSLARPGGFTTGMASLSEDLTPKLLESQREVVPKASAIAALFNPGNPTNPPYVAKLSAVAAAMGITVLPFALKAHGELDAVFSALVAQHPDTLQLVGDTGNMDLADRIAALAIAHRIPAFSTYAPFAILGGLLTYGITERDLFTRAAYYVKRIVGGATPSELPVEQPTRIALVINLKTAKALDLSIPPALISRADELIE